MQGPQDLQVPPEFPQVPREHPQDPLELPQILQGPKDSQGAGHSTVRGQLLPKCPCLVSPCLCSCNPWCPQHVAYYPAA